MRLLKLFLITLTSISFLVSCQKEMSLELGLSEGTLTEDPTGICFPSTVMGRFKEDSLLNATHYIEIQVNIIETGTYIIKSDTINGYSFSGGGTLDVTGPNTIRLFASGRPVDPGVDRFTIRYDTSNCMIDVSVIAVGPPAAYTLGGAGSTCTGVMQNGVYMVSVPMNPTNTVTVDVNVTTIGSYELITNTVNGISFSGIGDFTTTGPQTVTLNGTGNPVAAGSNNYILTGNSSTTCTFPVTIGGGTPSPAVFTYGGAGASCTGFVPTGTYTSGTMLNATNTVTINVNVTTIGSYSISTTAANGVSFSKIGLFTTMGAQTVTLTGSGTPTAAGAITHTISGAGGCSFSITYATGAPQATYTLSGAPGACTVATVAGTYTAGTALTAANTVTVQVVATLAGAYSLSTTTVGGMTFANSGTLTMGTQTVVLTGTGTPTAGTHSFGFTGSSSCTFSVTVTGGTSDVLSAKIDNVTTSFIDNFDAFYYTFPSDVAVEGFVALATSPEKLEVNVDKETAGPGTAVTAGTYTNAGSAPNEYVVLVEYIDNAGNSWRPRGLGTGGTPSDAFSITITSITATRIIGTFTGIVRDNGGTGTVTKQITEGVFNLPF